MTNNQAFGLATRRDVTTHGLLRESIREGRCVAFVGAGLSARAGFSDWSGLLRDLADKAEKKTQRRPLDPNSVLVKDMSWRAEEIRDLIAEEKVYLDILSRRFNRAGKRDAAVDAFARLKFRHFFTTNYDLSLESALRRHLKARRPIETINWLEPKSPSKVMRSFGEAGDHKAHLVYLHGKADAPNTIVLSERDYQAQYVRSDETVRKLFAIFSMRQVAFFGFSLDDIDLLSIFRQVRAANEDALHFAVIRDPGSDERERLRARFISKYGIHPVFYEPGGDGHPNLLPLIQGLDSSRRAKARSEVRSLKALPRDTKWTATSSFRKGLAAVDPEDPQKGRFGGLAVRNGRRLRAKVTPAEDGGLWYDLEIEVVPTNPRKPIEGKVDLWVHDSFPQSHYWTQARGGKAKFSFSVYGAFTVGAVVDGGMTPLELDLAKLPDAPDQFLAS